MNFKNELKYQFKKFFFTSLAIEIQEALISYRYMENKLKNDFDTNCVWEEIANNLDRKIILNQKWFLDSVKSKNKKPREMVYLWLYNNATKSLQHTDMFELSKRNGLEKSINILVDENNLTQGN